MSDDFPTYAEVGEQNIRERAARLFGEPADYLLNYIENEYERM
jgi:hypothetical protein